MNKEMNRKKCWKTQTFLKFLTISKFHKIIKTNNYSNSELIDLNLNVVTGIYIINLESEDKKAVIRLLKK